MLCGAATTLGAPAASADPLNTTTTTLAADSTTPVVGQSVTYTATVTVDAPASGTPTGTVTFSDTDGASAPCASQPLTTTGTIEATCTLTYIEVGSDTMVAQYNGDAANTGSASSPVAVTTGQAATSLRLGSSGNPSRSGRPVALRTTVSAVAPGSGIPTGTLTYAIVGGGGPVQCQGGDTVTLLAGRATCKVAAGTLQASSSPYTVTETYSGDANYLGSGGQLTQTVSTLPTRTKVVSSQNPSTQGAAVSFTALIRPHPASTPEPQSGTVTFTITTTGAAPPPVCNGGDTIILFAGQATCNVNSLTALGSPYQVVAAYSGDADNGASTSRTLHQRVSR